MFGLLKRVFTRTPSQSAPGNDGFGFAADPPSASRRSFFAPAPYEVTHTYVPRPEAEAAVQDRLRHQNAIILFSGPSKSGKTVLSHRYSTGLPKAHIHVYQP